MYEYKASLFFLIIILQNDHPGIWELFGPMLALGLIIISGIICIVWCVDLNRNKCNHKCPCTTIISKDEQPGSSPRHTPTNVGNGDDDEGLSGLTRARENYQVNEQLLK